MNIRNIFGLLLITLVIFVLPICAGADTYRLPVRTATFAVPFDYYQGFVNGEPIGPYDFYIDPQTLRVGYDLSSGLVYESAIVFDWNEFPDFPEGTIAYANLHLTAVSPPSNAYCSMPEIFELDHSLPQRSDFDWLSHYGGDPESGGIISVPFGFDPKEPNVHVFTDWPVKKRQGYRGWILTTVGSTDPMIDIAGINNSMGLEAPYILVTTVPEPTTALCLGTALFSLGGFLVGARKRQAWLLTICIVSLLSVMAIAVLADDDMELNSEPGGGTRAVLTSARMPVETAQARPKGS
ncbi:MAG: PEP-CTERM sorting domain-containing protein [Armatimonadetes bacterium]|nr:PEP-CTERM sorting domain-containing protein [Armatimonadota bacterium]